MESEETITVCGECGAAIEGISCGDEGWTVCPECQIIEGKTYEITLEEYEGRD